MSDYPVMSALLPAFLGWWAVVIWKSKPRPAVSSMVMSGTLILAGFAMIVGAAFLIFKDVPAR